MNERRGKDEEYLKNPGMNDVIQYQRLKEGVAKLRVSLEEHTRLLRMGDDKRLIGIRTNCQRQLLNRDG